MSSIARRLLLRRKKSSCLISQLRRLNLQEFQSKELLHSNGCKVQNFFVVDNQTNSNELDSLFNKFDYSEFVVKAQILAGGRGKGHFLDDHRQIRRNLNGVFITNSSAEAKNSINNMIGRRLVTKQTTENGVLVNRVMVAQSVAIRRETYISILMDATSTGPVIVACPIGGMDIEEVAKKQPEMILKEIVPITDGLNKKQCMKIAKFLQFEGKLAEKAAQQIKKLYDLFIKVDAVQIEINPFAETEDEEVYCIDAKFNFDDNAAFRQKNIFNMDTLEEMDMREINAKKFGLNYIGLDGNIACMVNGAGLAMATMDIIKLNGGTPANFLDVGGGATVQQVYEAFKIITTDACQVRVIFVNIFGGIMCCDTIAEGVIKACSELNLGIPVVLRLKGTRVEEAKALLSAASLNGNNKFELLDSFDEAAKRAVQLAGNGEQQRKMKENAL